MQTRLVNLSDFIGLLQSLRDLDAFLDVPDKGSQSQHLGFGVDAVESLEQDIDFLVLHDGDDGGAGGRPCVCAVVRFSRIASSTACQWEKGESPAVGSVECSQYFLV